MIAVHLFEAVTHSYVALASILPTQLTSCVIGEDQMHMPIPLYRIVSKFKPCKFGKRNVFLELSHDPSPT